MSLAFRPKHGFQGGRESRYRQHLWAGRGALWAPKRTDRSRPEGSLRSVSTRGRCFVSVCLLMRTETVPNMGVLTSAHGRPGAGMEWRGTIELSGADGTKQTYEVSRGGGTDPHSTFDPLGLTLDDGKTLLAGVQRHLVQARVAEYSALRRRCSHCRGLRPLKDTRTRRLNSLFRRCIDRYAGEPLCQAMDD